MKTESIELVISVPFSECQGDVTQAEVLLLEKCEEITFFNTYTLDEVSLDSTDHEAFYFNVTYM